MFSKPRVVISKCIEFEPVRYNGQIISSDLVRELIKHVEPIPVCPEVGIGLSVPRESLRLVKMGADIRLIQPKTRNDYTDEMKSFAEQFFSELGMVDGFIMRSSSPSSGITRVKIYSGIEKSPMTLHPRCWTPMRIQRLPDRSSVSTFITTTWKQVIWEQSARLERDTPSAISSFEESHYNPPNHWF